MGERESNKPQNVKTGMGVRERERERKRNHLPSVYYQSNRKICVCIMERGKESEYRDFTRESVCVCARVMR